MQFDPTIHTEKKERFPSLLDMSLYIGFKYLIYLKKRKSVSPPCKYIFLGFMDKPIIETVMPTIPYRFSNITYISLSCPVYQL